MKQSNVPQWNVFEKTLTTQARYTNPFTDVHLSVRLNQGAVVYYIDGFYDGLNDNAGGESVWRFRFAPLHKGRWEYQTSSKCLLVIG